MRQEEEEEEEEEELGRGTEMEEESDGEEGGSEFDGTESACFISVPAVGVWNRRTCRSFITV